MCAVLFCPLPILQSVCNRLKKEGLCEITNINSPVQQVVSGERSILAKLSAELRKEAEGKRVRVQPLNVSYPFHCSLLLPAAQQLNSFIHEGTVTLKHPLVPVISNVDASVVLPIVLFNRRCRVETK